MYGVLVYCKTQAADILLEAWHSLNTMDMTVRDASQ